MSDPNGDGQLSVVLFSGTDDKLTAASILVAGAAALGRRVDILLQYWGLEAFRRGRVQQDHGLSVADDAEGAGLVAAGEAPRGNHWSETLRQAKDIGEVRVHACAHSMELFHLVEGDLDPLVDDVSGVASFMAGAEGQIVFV